MSRRAISRLLLSLFAVHLLWVGLRVPYSVVYRRALEIARFRERGVVASHIETGRRSGTAVVEWILANTGVDEIVLYRGPRKGTLEFVPALIYPRLLVSAAAVEPTAREYRGRPIAVGSRDRRRGQIVVLGDGDRIDLEVR